MEQRLSLITLGAENVQTLTHFYVNIFGWKPLPSSNDDITFFQLNGFQLSIYNKQALANDAGVTGIGNGHNSCTLAYNLDSRDKVNALFEELKAKGANIIKEPQEVFWGGYSGYIADPEHNLWEIAYNPFMQFDDSGNVLPPNV